MPQLSQHLSHVVIKKQIGDLKNKPLVVVPKTIFPKATKRNLIKRRIREVLGLIGEKNNSFVLIAKKGIDLLSFTELTKEIKTEIKNKI